MSEPAVPFPAGRQFAVTWGVTTEYGGMTSAMLRRSRAFVELAGTEVDVLTFDLRDDYDAIETTLRADGRLSSGMSLRNLWDELSSPESWDRLGGSKKRALEAFAPLDPLGGRTRTRAAADGTVLQIDRYRTDGTLAVSDRRDVNAYGSVGGRSIVLCDAVGEPVQGFTGARALYRAWLDTVVGDDEAFFIVDSKTAAPVVAGYENPLVTRIHLLHSSHLVGDSRPWGVVKPTRREGLAAIGAFESVVVLSERQRSDAETLFHLGERLDVVPNSAPLPAAPPSFDRDPLRGIVVGSLDGRKRVDHAVEAVLRARRAGAWITLDVYGDGPGRADLEAQVQAAGDSGVTFHGFRADAIDSFAGSSFFLLTSVSEGFPLVLAEGMSRGCVPFAYDIAYGPADMIEDGLSGFLVPPADVDALAALLLEFADSPPERIAGLRRGAVGAAASFTDEVVTKRWAAVMERARLRRPTRRGLKIEIVGPVQRGPRRVTVDFRLAGADVAPKELAAAVALHGDDGVELRVPATAKRTLRHGVWRLSAAIEAPAAALLSKSDVVTGHVEIRAAGASGRSSFAVE